MIRIYDVKTAEKTILRRVPLSDTEYPAHVIEGTQELFGTGVTPPQAVAQILASVREKGDAALEYWSERLDGKSPQIFKIPPESLREAYDRLPESLARALEIAAGRIRQFHALQPLQDWETQSLGGRLGQRVTPVKRAGVYVPGGTAPLPSSLLMSAIPAQVAGVEQIVVCTPPDPHPTILAAAYLCEIEDLFQVGGAQAIAALAYGTETIPRVDKIVGAGNLWVTLAKQQVFGVVGLDGLAGPTETMVIADQHAKPAWVAADLLAQAEHDVLASAILLTPDRGLALAVQAEVARQLEELSRADIIAHALKNQGGIVITPDLRTAARLANEYAAEHLCLAVEDPTGLAGQINNAGGFFLGEHSFEVLGDYVAGPSHVMPTGGTARFASPLNVLDFVKISSIVALDPETTHSLSALAAEIAEAETLTAHASAARYREVKMSIDPESLVRAHIQEMPAYEPILPFEVLSRQLELPVEEIIKLDANENPYGPLPVVLQELGQLEFTHIYPDPESRDLRRSLAEYHGVPMEYLLAGAGADELIDLIMRLVIEPGDRIINCPPTFGMYAFDGDVNHAEVLSIPRKNDFSLDLATIRHAVNKHGPKLIFLASPNNPDGSLIPPDIILKILELPVTLVLDEAYIEFASPGASYLDKVPKFSNLIVLRTFSKWAGLAGLRVGYGVFPLALMPHLWKIKQPYNVSVAAYTAARLSLEGVSELQSTGAKLISERERLYEELKKIPWLDPYPSQANFILCRVRDRDAGELKNTLARSGILVRYFNKPGLSDHIRISVGKPEHTDALIARLTEME